MSVLKQAGASESRLRTASFRSSTDVSSGSPPVLLYIGLAVSLCTFFEKFANIIL